MPVAAPLPVLTRPLLLSFALLALWAPASVGQAQTPVPGVVVTGRVAGADTRWDDTRTLYTYVTIEVTRVLVGVDVPPLLVLKQLGGETGGIGLRVEGQATFLPHEDVLLDLSAHPVDGTLRTRQLGAGKWSIETLAGVPTAVQSDVDGPRRREPFAAVEARLRSSRVPAAHVTAVPAERLALTRTDQPLFALLPTDGGYPARWHEVDSYIPVFVDHAAVPGTWVGGTTANATAAINLWRASGMDLDLRDGGAVWGGACPASFTGSGRIAVAYNDPCGTVNDWVVGGGYYTVGDLRTVNGTTYQKFLQGFVVLDATGPQTSSAGCFQDAITHGLGHALGLGHSGVSGAIMTATPPAACATAASGLGADDISGITAIYDGIASAAAPPDTPTAFNATSSLSTVTMSWTPASTGGAAQRFLIDAGTAPGVYNLGSLVVNAPATATSVPNAPPGTYYVRVKAQNVLGTSAASPETSVSVGACTPPGTPATFTATSNDQNVLLQWSAPATGVVQGYQVTAGSGPGLANIAVLPFGASVTSLAGAVPYGRYYVRVAATNICGTGAPSPEVVLNVQACSAPPAAPTGLTASVANRVVTLTWNAAAGPAPTGYRLAAGSGPGVANILVYATGSTATGLVAAAPPGTYYVRVAATNACGVSGESNEFVVVVP